MKTETGTKYALVCLTAGTLAAGIPVIAACILGSKAKKDKEKNNAPEETKEPEIITGIGSSFVNREGAEISLRGINISEFSVSCRKNGKALTGDCREIFNCLEERFGSYGAREVFGRYLDSSVSEKDLKILKKAGINCLCIPVRDFLTEKYGKKGKATLVPEHLDKITDLCGKAGIKIILTVLSAPEDKEEKYIAFVSSLSEHFRENENVAAYELLPAAESGYSDLCIRAAKEIRASGDKHIIIIDDPSVELASSMACTGCAAGLTVGDTDKETANALRDKLAAFEEAKIPSVILSDKLPFDGFFNGICKNSVTGYFKGSNLKSCMYCKTKEIVDIGKEKFDDINKKLADSLETKTYSKT